MRHPAVLSMMLPILLPIILSPIISFIILLVAAIIMMIVYFYYGCYLEEKKLDIPKWSDEYRQYMKEVPRFNFVLGI
jgi:protein-S-isoprenylcysteine O-methyltransferase Ste14